LNSPEVVVFDGWEQVSAFEKESLSQKGQPHVRRILLLHFPRPEDRDRAREASIDAVLGQPLSLADLRSALGSALAPAA
jgi:hypothetical protein